MFFKSYIIFLLFPAPYGTTISRMPQDILHPANLMMDPSLDPSGRGKKVTKVTDDVADTKMSAIVGADLFFV
jgi:hypothetical protein